MTKSSAIYAIIFAQTWTRLRAEQRDTCAAREEIPKLAHMEASAAEQACLDANEEDDNPF